MMTDIDISGSLNKLYNEIMGIIMSDQKILKFLYYNKDEDVLNKPDLTKKQIASMKNINFFKHKKIPTVETNEMRTAISFEYEEVVRQSSYGSKEATKYWYKPMVCIYVIGHSTNDNTKNGSRVWGIEDRIVELFHFTHNEISLGASSVIKSEDIYGLPYPYFGRAIYIQFWDKNQGMF